MNLRRITAAALTTAALAAAITACGAADQPVTYAPAAYGVPGHCYYVDDPAEAVALENAGLCPRSWVPTLMPLAWHEAYWDYYDSPGYYGTYVPARIRTVYVHHEATFGRTYRTAIKTRARAATYRSSTGQTVRGVKVGKARFGSGTSFGTTGRKYGGGSARTGTSSRTSRTGTSSGSRSSSRSGGFGGGSARSGRSR